MALNEGSNSSPIRDLFSAGIYETINDLSAEGVKNIFSAVWIFGKDLLYWTEPGIILTTLFSE